MFGEIPLLIMRIVRDALDALSGPNSAFKVIFSSKWRVSYLELLSASARWSASYNSRNDENGFL